MEHKNPKYPPLRVLFARKDEKSYFRNSLKANLWKGKLHTILNRDSPQGIAPLLSLSGFRRGDSTNYY